MGKNIRCRKATLAIAALLVAGALYPITALAANKLIVNGTDGVTPAYVVTDSGFLGIGTSAPATAINVVGNTQVSTQLKMFNNLNGAATLAGGGLLFGHNNGTALPLKGDRLGYLNAGAIDDVDLVSPKYGGGFQFDAADNWVLDRTTSPGNQIYHFPTSLKLKTADYNTGNIVGPGGGSKVRLMIFPAGNVYIGSTPPTTPTMKVEIDGGVRLNATTAKPATCDATIRGTLWFTNNGSAKDALEVCAFDGSSYAWRTLY